MPHDWNPMNKQADLYGVQVACHFAMAHCQLMAVDETKLEDVVELTPPSF
jgi:hypothetical protein